MLELEECTQTEYSRLQAKERHPNAQICTDMPDMPDMAELHKAS